MVFQKIQKCQHFLCISSVVAGSAWLKHTFKELPLLSSPSACHLPPPPPPSSSHLAVKLCRCPCQPKHQQPQTASSTPCTLKGRNALCAAQTSKHSTHTVPLSSSAFIRRSRNTVTQLTAPSASPPPPCHHHPAAENAPKRFDLKFISPFFKAGGETLGSFQLNTTSRPLCQPLRTRGNTSSAP